ncbi:hypothetical protein ACFWNK_34790 [Streptomyces sp. NPDC058417]|uniref:hypothetical protein n=1 Tax=unclassified Streptomyces TaxID=2593676 RepID=UPI0036578959
MTSSSPSVRAPGQARPRRRLTPQLVAALRRDVSGQRTTIYRAAEEIGVAWRTVESAVYGFTWRSVTDPPPLAPPPPQTGTTTSRERLTVAVVAQMRRQYRAGNASYGDLARRHAVSESAVRSAVLGHTWRRVDAVEAPAARAAVGGWTVLSEADERAIVAARRQNPPVPYRQIAAQLGHDVAVVHRAYRRLAAPGDGTSGP